jgi:hypothetical protein
MTNWHIFVHLEHLCYQGEHLFCVCYICQSHAIGTFCYFCPHFSHCLYSLISSEVWSLFATLFNILAFVNAGFKSKVKFFIIVDPSQMSYYISEILDIRLQGPLLMVIFSFVCTSFMSVLYYLDRLMHLQMTVENYPSEFFANSSHQSAGTWSVRGSIRK